MTDNLVVRISYQVVGKLLNIDKLSSEDKRSKMNKLLSKDNLSSNDKQLCRDKLAGKDKLPSDECCLKTTSESTPRSKVVT